jgi:DNA mismatch repair protein MSH3
MTKRARDAGDDVADAYRCVCMREPTQEQHAAFPAALTPLDRQVYSLRKQLPPSVMLLVVCGYKVKLYGRDSRVASRRFGIVCVNTTPFESSSFPVVRLPHYLTRLTEMGYHTALADQVETAAIRASGTKTGTKVFERNITAMYSRATTSSASFETLYQSSAAAARKPTEDDDGDGEGAEEQDNEAGPCTSSATVEGAAGGTQRRLQEASLRWILLVAVSVVDGLSLWSWRLISLLSLVQSSIESVCGNDAALVQLRDVFLKCDPCEIICDSSSAAAVLSCLDALGECPLHQGPTFDGVEDSCTRTFISDFQSSTIERLGLEYADRFRSSHVLEKVRTLPLQEIIAGHDVRSMHLPATACNALGLFPLRNWQGHSSMRSLVELLDRCSTKVGSRMLRRWVSAPLCDAAAIHNRQETVQSIAGADSPLRAVLDAIISAVKGYLSDPQGRLLLRKQSHSFEF